jgi:hypothetical protein
MWEHDATELRSITAGSAAFQCIVKVTLIYTLFFTMNIQQTPQLIGLLNANLDLWVGATIKVVCTEYEISKCKLNLSLPVRSR